MTRDDANTLLILLKETPLMTDYCRLGADDLGKLSSEELAAERLKLQNELHELSTRADPRDGRLPFALYTRLTWVHYLLSSIRWIQGDGPQPLPPPKAPPTPSPTAERRRPMTRDDANTLRDRLNAEDPAFRATVEHCDGGTIDNRHPFPDFFYLRVENPDGSLRLIL